MTALIRPANCGNARDFRRRYPGVSRNREASVVGMLVVTLLLAGCGGGGPDAAERRTPSGTDAVATLFNKADEAFVLDAGRHLGQTLSAAQLAMTLSSDPDVVSLARDIVQAKGRQVDQVAGWLRAWGKQGADFGHDAAAHGHADSTEGLPDETMQRLQTLQGQRFDAVYLPALANHLGAGAVLWRAELAKGQNPDALTLARRLSTQDAAFADRARSLLNP